MDAGDLRERVTLLELTETSEGYEWAEGPTVWANVELTGKTNLFSRVGIGARDAKITLRRRPLTLHQAVRWRGQHLFLSEILPPADGFMEVKAAVVSPKMWAGQRFRTSIDTEHQNQPRHETLPPLHFPGIITEKYLGHQMDERHASTVTTYVLVTPKAVELSPGDLVSVLDTEPPETYKIQVAHTLDVWKNEYEITRKKDV